MKFKISTFRTRPVAVTVFLVSTAALSWVATTYAQSQSKPPYALFEFANLVGSGNNLRASRIPVVVGRGKTIYKDLSIQFDVDPDGNLTVSTDNPTYADAPDLQVSSFKAGRYLGPGSILGGKTQSFVDGPGATEGGATVWSFTTDAGADTCTYPSSATWFVGPAANTPVAARIREAKITSTAWSFGVANGPRYADRCSNGSLFDHYHWAPGTLIGVSQSGNAITIASFSNSFYRQDYSAPVAQITYRLAP